MLINEAKRQSLRVLHLPHAVAGNAYGLAQGEKALGLHSEVLYRDDSPFDYAADHHLGLQQHRSKLMKLLKLTKTFYQVRKQYDIFHFNYGSSLLHYPALGLNLSDLPWYPQQAKLFATYHGCDARQKFPTMQRTPIAACHVKNCTQGWCESGKQDQYRRRAITKMAKHVTHIWAMNPDLLYFLPADKASFLPYAVAANTQETVLPRFSGKFNIVHAPSDRGIKGTLYIQQALQQLAKHYPNQFEFHLVEGVSQQQALQLYRQADLVIDQVLIGWYGSFAVEVMQMGKPVIARIEQQDLQFIPPAMKNHLLETIIQAEPHNLFEILAGCMENRNFLREKSEAALSYARRWHDPRYVAGLTRARYEGGMTS